MKREKPDPSRHDKRQIPIVVKISLCLWMGAVMIIFLVLFMPPEYLSIFHRFDISDRLLSLRQWIKPFFDNSSSTYIPP